VETGRALPSRWFCCCPSHEGFCEGGYAASKTQARTDVCATVILHIVVSLAPLFFSFYACIEIGKRELVACTFRQRLHLLAIPGCVARLRECSLAVSVWCRTLTKGPTLHDAKVSLNFDEVTAFFSMHCVVCGYV
jgi:hypothetical protein